jgi:hypothetical protein
MNQIANLRASSHLRVAVLELLAYTVASEWELLRPVAMFKRQFYSVMPQVVAVWARQLGHQVSYATYYGQADAESLLPDDIDIVFIAASSQASALAYALAKLFRARGVATVIGGPHAKGFPEDCSRFCDVTVQECDKALLADILVGQFPPGSIVGSRRPPTVFPSLEERLPEIAAAAFHKGRASRASVISLYSSTGCPFGCGFCTDWNSHYAAVPQDQLRADLAFASSHFPGTILGFQDPNFGIRMDDTLDALESVPAAQRSPYLMQCSMASLTPARLARLQATRCLYVAPGIESWNEFGAKLGARTALGQDRADRLAASFTALRRFIPGFQANFVMGLDSDSGDESFDLTAAFIDRVPFVWPNINILTPYGGTPMHTQFARERRLLPAMPLSLYCSPYLAYRPRHYAPVEFYDRFIRLLEYSVSPRMTLRRAIAADRMAIKLGRLSQTIAVRRDIVEMRAIRDALNTDPHLRAFHDGRSDDLPPLYMAYLRKRLGKYAGLLTDADLRPVQPAAQALGRVRQAVPG